LSVGKNELEIGGELTDIIRRVACPWVAYAISFILLSADMPSFAWAMGASIRS
jgi:hypothetical protein